MLTRCGHLAVIQAREGFHARVAWLLLTVFAVSDCNGAALGPSELPTGNWGGDHIAMTVGATSTHIELDCAHADVPTAFGTNERGEFSVAGTFVREHGGPIRIGEIADAHPATFAGSVTATAMVLTIRLADSSDVIGPFSLARGAIGRVVKCL
jgi:hypothetical protein